MISEILFTIVVFSLFILAVYILAMAITSEDKISVLKGIYVYVVSIVSLGVFLIGIGMGVYNILGRYVFPKAIDAEYRYTLAECNPAYQMPEVVKLGSGVTMTDEQQAAQTAKCEQERSEKITEQKEVDFSRNMLTAFVLILIGIPVYVLHFFYFRKHI